MVPASMRKHHQVRSSLLSMFIAEHFLGRPWVLRNFISTEESGHLTIDFDASVAAVRIYRAIQFAEAIFNLQHIEGFPRLLHRLRTNDIEATYAELDIAGIMYANSIKLRFVGESGVKGMDYDYDLEFPDGRKARADAKCKLEGKSLTASSIKNTLTKARSQFPPGGCGIIIVKIPQEWMEVSDYRHIALKVADEFLLTTKRVVSVQFYINKLVYHDEMVQPEYHTFGIDSRNSLVNGLPWRIMTVPGFPLADWRGYRDFPEFWTSLRFFPGGRPT